jgi:RNA-binding protein YlmH
MGLGFSRDRLGDIVVTADRKAYAAVMPELAVYVVEHLTSAGKTPVSVAEVPLFEAPVSEPGEEVTLSVSSLRLDALLTAGFRQSRTRAKEAVEGGLVYVDWQQTEHAEREVKPGQVVSWRGHGRLEISAVAPKGDRYRVTLVLRK